MPILDLLSAQAPSSFLTSPPSSAALIVSSAAALIVLVAIAFLAKRRQRGSRRKSWLLPTWLGRWTASSSGNSGGGTKYSNNNKNQSREERERRAKRSFSVRKSDLVSIGRGEPTGRQRRNARNRRRRQEQQRQQQQQRQPRNGTISSHCQRRDCAPPNGLSACGGASWMKSWTDGIASIFSWPTFAAHEEEDVAGAAPDGDDASADGLGGLDGVAIMGVDCEMVGAGRDGNESLLARCSVVLLDASEHDAQQQRRRNGQEQEEQSEGQGPEQTFDKGSNEILDVASNEGDCAVRVLYDKYVRPTKTVTDYRTQWSGITRNDLRGEGDLPVVPFDVCRREVSELFASYDGRPVVVVGHALKNDFDVLKLRHPFSLTRDTATYRPFMREGRTNRRMVQRKLSHLAEEELGMTIQNSSGGHSSVEDATAALRLYWANRRRWEASLGYPLRSYSLRDDGSMRRNNVPGQSRGWKPVTLYLDGCNLPLGVRCHKQRVSNGNSYGGVCNTPTWQIISKTAIQGTKEVPCVTDWVPIFKYALATSSLPAIDKVVVMFDGAKYQNSKKERQRPPSVEISPGMFLETTEVGVQVDDVLCERCGAQEAQGSTAGSSPERRHDIAAPLAASGPIVSVEDVIDVLGDMSDLGFGAVDGTENDRMDSYVVVRRRGGGSKTNRRLFDRLHLRRPEEGALCLPGLTARLQRNGLKIARELQRARVYGVVEYELRSREGVRSVVVTDDVLLTDRLVRQNVIVLSYRQLQQMF